MDQGLARVARVLGHGFDVTRAGGLVGGLWPGQALGGGGSGGGDKSRKRAEGVKIPLQTFFSFIDKCLTLRLLACNLPAKAASRVLLPDPGGPSRRVMRPGGMTALRSSRMLKCLVEDCMNLNFWNKACTSS